MGFDFFRMNEFVQFSFMLVLDKIRGLNQLYAKYFVLKRASARIYCMLACTETTETLRLTEGPVQTSEIKITVYPDFPYAPGYELLSRSNFTQACLLNTHTNRQVFV